MRGEVYTEDFKPTYVVRDESYGGNPRFFIHRVVPSGDMSWGVTSYTDSETAQKVADFLNELVLKEVP